MKKKYLIVVAGPGWDSSAKDIFKHDYVKMRQLMKELVEFELLNAPSVLLRTGPHQALHILAKEITRRLGTYVAKEDDRRFLINYKFAKRMETMQKYFSQQTLADIKMYDLVIMVGYNDLTRDLPELLLKDHSHLRRNGCEHCQAIMLGYEDNSFSFEKYLNFNYA